MRYILIVLMMVSIQISAATIQDPYELHETFRLQHQRDTKKQNAIDDFNRSIFPPDFDLNRSDNTNRTHPLYAYYYYNDHKKNPWVGLGLSIFPTFGHAYAGKWVRSLPFLVADVAAFFLISDSFTHQIRYYDTIYGPFFVREEYIDETKLAIGCGILVISTLWEIIDILNIIEDYNSNLRQKLKLHITYAPNHTLRTGLTYTF